MSTVPASDAEAPSIDWRQTDLYRFFDLVFGAPSRQCFDFLSMKSARNTLLHLWKYLKCEGEFPSFEWFTSYESYEAAYIALFDVGLPEPPVPLFESAHDKSHPPQEIALENTYFYDVLGLRSNPCCAAPDYLVTQLEFLAALTYTREHTADEASATSLARAETEFLERHLLNWIPAATAKLERMNAPAFPVLMKMLLRFLKNRHKTAEGKSKSRTWSLP